MPRYKPYDYKQSKLVVIDYESQLQPGTFEHALHHLVDEKLDLSIFDASFHNDETGRPGYDPAILLKIVLFAYSKGVTSSREIEWNCRNNILFKALSCDTVPHWTTIAHFISSYHDEVEELFEQVLLVCDEQGLLGKELFALDGCKLPSNASKEWSGTFKELKAKRRKIRGRIRALMTAHQSADEAAIGDEARAERSEQTLETLNRASEKIERFLKAARPRMGRGKRTREVKSNITDNDSAKITTSKGTIQGYTGLAAVDGKHQVIVDAQAFGDGQEQHTLEAVTEAVRQRFKRLGISPDIYAEGARLTADSGFANEANMRYVHEAGIDAYIPDTQFRSRDARFAGRKAQHGKRRSCETKPSKWFPSSAFRFDPKARTCVCPAGSKLALRGEEVDKRGNRKLFFEGYLLQCRDCELKHRCLRNPQSADHRNGHGRQVSFILEKGVRLGNYYTSWMRNRVDSEAGKRIYSHRMSVAEPVFGNITTNKKLKRFSLRSHPKVQGQWRLFCLVHNIEKLMNYGTVPG